MKEYPGEGLKFERDGLPIKLLMQLHRLVTEKRPDLTSEDFKMVEDYAKQVYVEEAMAQIQNGQFRPEAEAGSQGLDALFTNVINRVEPLLSKDGNFKNRIEAAINNNSSAGQQNLN